MGRTGRHGAGRIVYLLASGKEEREYAKNLQLAKSLDQQVRSGRFQLEQRSPRMVPRQHVPAVQYQSLGEEFRSGARGLQFAGKRGSGKAEAQAKAPPPAAAGDGQPPPPSPGAGGGRPTPTATSVDTADLRAAAAEGPGYGAANPFRLEVEPRFRGVLEADEDGSLRVLTLPQHIEVAVARARRDNEAARRALQALLDGEAEPAADDRLGSLGLPSPGSPEAPAAGTVVPETPGDGASDGPASAAKGALVHETPPAGGTADSEPPSSSSLPPVRGRRRAAARLPSESPAEPGSAGGGGAGGGDDGMGGPRRRRGGRKRRCAFLDDEAEAEGEEEEDGELPEGDSPGGPPDSFVVPTNELDLERERRRSSVNLAAFHHRAQLGSDPGPGPPTLGSDPADENDDFCGVCGRPGELLLCDGEYSATAPVRSARRTDWREAKGARPPCASAAWTRRYRPRRRRGSVQGVPARSGR